MKVKLFILLYFLMFFWADAQENLKLSEYELTPVKGIVFFKEHSFTGELSSNGFSFGFNKGKITKYYLTKYYHVDIAYIKDSKQRKKSTYQPGFYGLSRYSFAKQNEVFLLRGGIGRKYYLSEKERKKGVAIGYSYEGGMSFALLKPYYLILEYNDELDRSYRTEAYSEENRHLFLDERKILDNGSFYKGWNELSFIPGAYAQIATHLSFGAYEKYIRALEIGIQLDTYIRRIPMLVETEDFKNSFLFPSFFVNFQLGKRSR